LIDHVTHHCCDDCWLSVHYNGTKQISIYQKVAKSTFYQKMKPLTFLPYF